jgi:hypothetical protein
LLGSHLLDERTTRNIICSVPPRGQDEINPIETLIRRTPWHPLLAKTPQEEISLYVNNIRSLGTFGLIDHVGSNHYTPFSFATELQQMGPSRRLTPALAQYLAPKTPFPIFFTHSDMPFFADMTALEEVWPSFCTEDDGYVIPCVQNYIGPTWMRWHWTPVLMQGSAYDDRGDSHYMTRVLRICDEEAEKAVRLERYESVFCGSWITTIRYVCRDGEDRPPPVLEEAGVEPLYID